MLIERCGELKGQTFLYCWPWEHCGLGMRSERMDRRFLWSLARISYIIIRPSTQLKPDTTKCNFSYYPPGNMAADIALMKIPSQGVSCHWQQWLTFVFLLGSLCFSTVYDEVFACGSSGSIERLPVLCSLHFEIISTVLISDASRAFPMTKAHFIFQCILELCKPDSRFVAAASRLIS